MREVLMQITAGQGPAECAWAVMKTLQKLIDEAAQVGLNCRVIAEPGNSALVAVAGDAELAEFAASWCGTVQWIGRSPFRPEHKRKNWFVGVEVFEAAEEIRFDAKDLIWETMRASGPGGQHVNRTESAVRVRHVASGFEAVASEERSQFSNRRLALARLWKKIAEANGATSRAERAKRWRAQLELERGNAVRVFRIENSRAGLE